MATAARGQDDIHRIAREQAREELFDCGLYEALVERLPDAEHRRLLAHLASHERRHAEFWLSVAQVRPEDVRPPRWKHTLLLALRRLLGVTFIIRWLERGEERAIARYSRLLEDPALEAEQRDELRRIIAEERGHEQQLEDSLGDERTVYLGAAVLGLNDALVELTGGLTGLVSSIRNTTLIGFSALIVGLAAAGSMAASNFLSVDIGESEEIRPGKAAAYTGIAYVVVVGLLVFPFFIGAGRRAALGITWAVAVVVIAGFSYYSAVIQGTSFRRRFTLMLALGLGVAAVTFAIGRVLGATLDIAA